MKTNMSSSNSNSDKVNPHAHMSSRTAYFLLFILLATLYWSLSPYLDELASQRSEIEVLTSRVEMLNTESERQREIQTEHRKTLESLYQNGEIYLSNSSLEASKQLQSTLKSAADHSNARVLQINPSKNNASTDLYETKLESNLVVQSDQLDDFLFALNSATPKPRVSSLSLRPSGGFGQSDGRSTELSVQLALTQFVAPTPNNLNNTTFSKIDANKRFTNTKERKSFELESIFSKALRERLRSPSLDYYRLGAITLSPDSKSILLSDKQNGKTMKLSEGDMLDSWKLTSISEKKANFSRGEEKYTLELE